MGVLFRFKRDGAATEKSIFDTRPSWEMLATRIKEIFHINLPNVSVAAVEPGASPIIIRNEAQLAKYYDSVSRSSDYRLVVEDIDSPDRASLYFFDSPLALKDLQCHLVNIRSTWTQATHFSWSSEGGE
jgi:hypothetical protein